MMSDNFHLWWASQAFDWLLYIIHSWWGGGWRHWQYGCLDCDADEYADGDGVGAVCFRPISHSKRLRGLARVQELQHQLQHQSFLCRLFRGQNALLVRQNEMGASAPLVGGILLPLIVSVGLIPPQNQRNCVAAGLAICGCIPSNVHGSFLSSIFINAQ